MRRRSLQRPHQRQTSHSFTGSGPAGSGGIAALVAEYAAHGADQERARIPYRCEHAAILAQFMESLFAPGEMIELLVSRVLVGISDLDPRLPGPDRRPGCAAEGSRGK